MTEVEDDQFTLDYGNDSIVVEMDDGDEDADASHLIVGDEVSVSGVVDDDFFEQATIEAGARFRGGGKRRVDPPGSRKRLSVNLLPV